MDNQVFELIDIFGNLPGRWVFPVAGLVAGSLAGCFGIGDGLVVVPAPARFGVGIGGELEGSVRQRIKSPVESGGTAESLHHFAAATESA